MRSWPPVAVLALACVALVFAPGPRLLSNDGARTSRAEVVEVDNSALQLHGLVEFGTQHLTVRLPDGRTMQAENELRAQMELDKKFAPGDTAVVVLPADGADHGALVARDHWRTGWCLGFFAAFCALLCVFGGWTGAKALFSFVFSCLAVWKLLIPLVLAGWHASTVTFLTVACLTGVIMYLVAGWTRKAFVAFAGSMLGVVASLALAHLVARAMHVNGATMPYAQQLLYSGYQFLDLQDVFVGAIILASSGAVMDLGMDIAAGVREVSRHNGSLGFRELFLSGLRMGRAVVGTMTTTLLLAYSGGYLTLLMVFAAQGTHPLDMLSSTLVSAEIVKTLVGSFGLVLVAPFTAFVAAAAFSAREGRFFGIIDRMSLKWSIYNALFAVVYVAMLPAFLLRMARRGGYRNRFSDRFGRYPEGLFGKSDGDGSFVWIHAVSVGEVAVAGRLMRELRAKSPGIRFAFSTTSSTGWKVAEKEVAEGDVLFYNPLDFPSCVRRAFDAVRPRAVILTESEIWPNFLREAKRRGLPLILANARVSDRSAPRYVRLKWFFGEVFALFDRIFAQSDLDASRLLAAGARREAVEVTGSFKFDVAGRNEAKERELAAWISQGLRGTRPGTSGLPPVLLGGSTWPGEDSVMLETYKALLEVCPDAVLAIAPRHFEKADAVEANIRAAGFDCVRRSRGDAAPVAGRAPVFLADTTGELIGLYGIATVVFIGKSLCEHGSQNMIEPCACGKATVVGPYTENFRPVMSDLLSSDAILQVKDAASLKAEVLRLFGDAAAREALGRRAADAVSRRTGVVARCADETLAAIAAACGRPREGGNAA